MINYEKMPQPTLEVAEHSCFIDTEKSCQAYELFRQALAECSPLAWEKLYAQHRRLVWHWVQKESSFTLSGEEAEDFANRAFEKMWHSITPAKFAKFADLPAILKYLHLCVRSVVIDEARRKQYRWLDLNPMANMPQFPDVAQEYGDTLQRAKFWSHIQARLKNQKERQLIYYRFVLGLKPNHICEQYRDTFANPDEVYRMLQNILARLRRDPALQDFALS